jgi:hypothetical protein
MCHLEVIASYMLENVLECAFVYVFVVAIYS